MSLEQWVNNGWLKRHEPGKGEIEDLLSVIDRDISDCLISGLSTDWKLSIAYNAALQSAIVALTASGYRIRQDQSHHYRAIQSLPHTIGAEKEIVVQLDAFRKKRNEMGYERAWVASEGEAEEMVELAQKLKERVQSWLCNEHPDLT